MVINKNVPFVVGILLGLVAATIAVVLLNMFRPGIIPMGWNTPKVTDDLGRIACPMDAKLCPDGSSVGRIGPHCEFASCPGEKTVEAIPEQKETERSVTGRTNDGSALSDDPCVGENVWNIVKEKNAVSLKDSSYTEMSEIDLSIDFGRYGSHRKDGGIFFGAWALYPSQKDLCEYTDDQITQAYVMEIVPPRSAAAVTESIRKMERDNFLDPDTGNLIEGVRNHGLETIGQNQVVVWEDYGGLPTHEWHFEVLRKKRNLHIHGTPGMDPDMTDLDYAFLRAVVSSIKDVR